MEPPKSAAGQLVVGALGLTAMAWAGATLNSRAVARANPTGATLAAATGAATGGLIGLFGATALAITNTKWKALGAATAVIGAGGFAALALVSLKASDRLLRAAGSSTQPQALLATENDNGGSFALHVGDTLTVELPAASTAGDSWVWTITPTTALEGPVQRQVTVDFGTVEHDTFTAATAGSVTLSAALTPTGGGTRSATWAGTATIS